MACILNGKRTCVLPEEYAREALKAADRNGALIEDARSAEEDNRRAEAIVE
jgi:hypothetical protein